MSYANSFRVIDVIDVPGRTESLVVLDVITGAASSVHGSLKSLEQDGEWTISSTPMVEPADMSTHSEGKRITVGIQGSSKLRPGLTLVGN